jgi:thiamine biosynthesis protein ThiS
MSATIEIVVNGEPRCVPFGHTVADLLAAMGQKAAQAAVERNKEIVRRADHARTVLAASDRLEVVTLFGGG